MTMSSEQFKKRSSNCKQKNNKIQLDDMKRGYKEMAEINLAISKLYFEVEREVEYYYDCLAECE